MLNASGCEHFFKSAMTWEWVVLDEGHRIRNPGTNLCQLVHKIESRGRLILSGTPLQVDTPDHGYSLLFWPCGCTPPAASLPWRVLLLPSGRHDFARWLLQNNMGELYELLHYGACVHTSGCIFPSFSEPRNS
jgi:hypothetical protein